MRRSVLALLCAAIFLPSCSSETIVLPGVDKTKAEKARGPHGGKMLREGDFAIELAMVEGEDVPPRFHAFAYRAGKQLPATDFALKIALKRLDGSVDEISFDAERDHLASLQTIGEPHSFDIVVHASVGSNRYQWAYESYEGRLTLPAAEAAAKGVTVERPQPAVLHLGRNVGGAILDQPERQILLNVAKADIEDIKVGQSVTLTTADGRAIGASRIATIRPFAEKGSFFTTISVAVPQAAAALPVGTAIKGRISYGSVSVPLAVRTLAIQHFRGARVVLARFGDIYEVRILEIGRQSDEWTEVKSGIEPGTSYVATNAFVLGSRLEKSDTTIVHAHN